jgi:CheY-like chemotaxis protein
MSRQEDDDGAGAGRRRRRRGPRPDRAGARAGALTVVQASDGDEALTLARGVRPALAVLDVQMPGSDGIAACHALKSDTLTAATAVVILTAEVGPEVRGRALAAGADAYLTKPFSPAALLALVRQLLPP